MDNNIVLLGIQRRLFFEKLILLLISGLIVVDTLNGLFVLSYDLPSFFSSVYKQGLLLLLVLYCLSFSKDAAILVTMSFMILLAWAIARFYLVDGLGFLYSFQESIKVFYFFFVLITLSMFQCLKPKYLSLILAICLLVLILNIFASYAGIGYFSYGGYGAKGFLYGGNAVSGIIIICSSYFLFITYKKSFLIFLITLIVLLLLAVVMGTKSGILGVLLCAVLILFFNFDARALLICILFIGFATIFFAVYSDSLLEMPLVNRIIHFYETGGIERALLSGREDKFRVIMPLFVSGNLFYILFGLDRTDLLKLGSSRMELDFFDMLVYFGGIFTTLVLVLYTIVFLRLVMCRHNVIAGAAVVSFIVLFFVSFIAGHVLFNGMITPLWGTLCAFAIRLSHSKSTPRDDNPYSKNRELLNET